MFESEMFHSWASLGRVAIVGTISYLFLIFMLRLSGNRTLSQMNAFDYIITIAMGSTFSTGMMQQSVPLANSLGALMLLIALQFFITKLSVYWKVFSKTIKSEPILVLKNSQYLSKGMKQARVTEDEILASIREEGFSSIEEIEAAILETNGKISVIAKGHPVPQRPFQTTS
jgi:uncharacterized membrane protein YcaP (DUF421 family)